MPKSVTKDQKGGVEYVSNVEQTQFNITELSRAALRDTAKLLRRRIKDMLRKILVISSVTSAAGSAGLKTAMSPTYGWGLLTGASQQKGLVYAYYATWQEQETAGTRQLTVVGVALSGLP